MIKRFISTLSVIFLAFGVYAESKYMTVEKNDGSKISFLLDNNPVITYQNDNLVINKDAKTTYSLEDIKNYHFTESDDSKVEMFSSNTMNIVWLDDATIEVKNAMSNTVVMLTAVNGVVVANTKADSEGKATVKIPNQAGVYVLSAGNQSFKIIRKK